MKDVTIEVLKGLTLKEIQGDAGSEKLTFITNDEREFVMYHSTDCCESVDIEDIAGDLKDLIGNPILEASEETNSDNPKTYGDAGYTYSDESHTWTFYKLATIKGSVTIRWYGSSNGYYSESVSFCEVKMSNNYSLSKM